MNTSKYPFEACLGSRLRSLSRKIDGIYRKYLGNSGVTENQLSIMMAVYKMGKVEQNIIAGFLNLEKSSLSRNLKRIIEAGYVLKDGPVNRPMIALSKPGREKVEDLVPRWEKAMDEIHEVLRGVDMEAFGRFERRILEM